MTLEQYIQNINSAYKRGNATEHTYRGDLKQLIESIVQDVAATNEPNISTTFPKWLGIFTLVVINPLKNGSKTVRNANWNLTILPIIKKSL